MKGTVKYIEWLADGKMLTSLDGKVVGGEVTCVVEVAVGESSWWRDDHKPN